ncbi:ADP-ribosylglycohydrolase family protein [bacterium]|nr:ADP-ribosylglycohydrolase family protein [bacterium]
MFFFVSLILLLTNFNLANSKTFKISKEKLQDKIKGGWAGQTIGCTFGGPTEFRHRGTIIQDYQPIPWYEGYLKWYYDNAPGLYDDIYMDLTFVDVFEKEGLDAPASSFAKAFANARYMLWHANQAARYNILHGIMPPESGNWLNNPHADDIDFQIEADFAGLMSPGMVNTASGICDKVGHIMNYGDGWYGGVYVAAMYALTFVSDDIHYVVEEALKVIPEETKYAKCMHDVIKWYKENPKDWKKTWFKVQRKWSEDVGCPEGVFDSFDIDAKINSAWILIGLLYGNGDFGKTISISARSGDDSDCNPASAGGILGSLLGYKNIPKYWKQGLAEVEPVDFKYTTISLNDVYKLSFKHALKEIERNKGKIDGDMVTINYQEPKRVKLEIGFKDHYPIKRQHLNVNLKDETSFKFKGIGFAVNYPWGGGLIKKGDKDYTFNVAMYIDGKRIEVSELPTNFTIRKYTPFWKYQLQMGEHTVRLKVLNPTDKAELHLGDVIIYSNKPSKPKY